MVDHAVGAVQRDTATVIRDFTSGADLFTLPGGPNGVSDVAYDSRSGEMIVLVNTRLLETTAPMNRPHAQPRLFVRNLARKGSAWKVHELPKENWADLVVIGLDAGTPEGYAVRVALNSKYVAVAYEGPRVRLLDRKTFSDHGEVELNHCASQLIQGPSIDYFALSKVGKVVALCVNNRMINSFSQSDLYLGAFGKKLARAKPDDAAPQSWPCAGLVPLAGAGWAYAFQDGTLQAYFPTASGSYRLMGKARLLGEDVSGSAYDGSNGWSYFVVDDRVRSVSFARWPHLEVHKASAKIPSTFTGTPEAYTFAGSRWLLQGEDRHVVLWEKGARGALTYRGGAAFGRSETLIALHS